MSDKTVYSYINDIAQRLKEPRKYGDVSLMIGAGFSKNAQSKGMASMQPPNWSELAEKMYEELYPAPLEKQEKEEWNRQRIIKTSGKNVTKLADEYIANFDRNKINNLIEQSIADEMFIPGELHKRLLKLHWSDIFTTNYDTLLEQTVDMIYRENNYEIIYSQNDLVAAVIKAVNENGEPIIFATQRGYGEFKDGWEFPGGKIEEGETPQDALKREIREELDTEISVGELIDTIEYDYPTFHLSMDCFWCEIVKGDLVLKEHEAARWLNKKSIDDVEWLPADITLIEKVRERL